ncbi:class I SAM-dependent methyltransferase [Rhodoferax sp.]|uniref:class I SAM-dependent methyltransferase n=1 Tax=Rhodoferax sp. TaxID=50421 RepID=UPI0025EE49E7|nr:class I SAM-dependent methyltransferase [Rhodoferax sp.]MCM2342363.1 methyltransferase domain-containing protein [Rhodoferax sp.]
MSVDLSISNTLPFAKRIWASFVRRYSRLVLSGPCHCVCCNQNSPFFLPFTGGTSAIPPVNYKLDVVGSDLRHYSCPKCESSDRERHLKLYCQKLEVDRLMASARVLHFAPERWFAVFVAAAGPSEHIKADLYPVAADIQKVDMLAMSFPNASFDLVIANHVLEHVADDAQALSEIHRVLRPGGWAILQTPYSAMLQTTFEDAGIVSRDAREHAYGQDDHVRLYGQDIFDRFAAAGFESRVARHETALIDIDPAVYGVNPREPFFLFQRA